MKTDVSPLPPCAPVLLLTQRLSTNDDVGSAISTPLSDNLNNQVTDLATLVTTASLLCSLLAVTSDKSGLHQATEVQGGGNTAPPRGNTTSLVVAPFTRGALIINDLHLERQGRKALQNQEMPLKPVEPDEFAVRFAGGFLEDQIGVKHSSMSEFKGSLGNIPARGQAPKSG